MPGIDRLFAETISYKLKKKLDKSDYKKIERKIFVKNGLSIKLAIENFSLINEQINSQQIKNNIIKNCFNEIFHIKELSSKDYQIQVLDKQLIEKILKLIQDEENFAILRSVINNDDTIDSIIKITKIPKTTAYRRIQKLLANGLLVIISKGKTTTRFSMNVMCVFKKIILEFDNNNTKITLIVPAKTYNKSTIKDFI